MFTYFKADFVICCMSDLTDSVIYVLIYIKKLHIRIRKHFITNILLVYIHVTLKYGPWNFHEFLKLYLWIFHELGILSKTHSEISCFFPHELGWSLLMLWECRKMFKRLVHY